MKPGPRRLIPVLLAAAVLRLVLILAGDRVTADVLHYQRVGEAVLAGRWNPYQLPGLYPYPPLWVWFEAASAWLAPRLSLGFAVVVKLPILAAELGIVALLACWGDGQEGARRAAWIYALHPVALLVSGLHGQFDPLMLLAVLLALRWQGMGRHDRSALALAAAIALKSFPILLLPLLAARSGSRRAALRYAWLATAPVGLLLLPYVWSDPQALLRELAGYGGIADFGWIALMRGLEWLRSGVLPRSEARHWGLWVPLAKLLFLTAYAALLAAFLRSRGRWTLPEATLLVFLAFQVLYGAVSAQYLLWVVPLAALDPDRLFAWHSLSATAALLGFYAFLQPVLLQAQPPLIRYSPQAAGLLWVAGVAALLASGAVWLAVRLRRRSAQG